jgi:AraC family transcriptional regulator, regulatory protein of adaptative response / methylated-DNA-[protein]-cysteine methyltransferase
MMTAALAFPSPASRISSMPSPIPALLPENPDDVWQLIVRRDPSADGRIFYAVRTTGVFCRPSCSSRRPCRKNVEFFTDLVSAFGAGYRPCKRCNPAGLRAEAQLVETLCAQLNRNLDRCVKLADLARISGLSTFTVLRTFQRVLGISPNQYRAHKRRAALRARLNDPAVRITDAIYDAGYSGPSRAYDRARLGMRPQDYRNRGRNLAIGYTTGASPLGRILIAATERGLCSVILDSNDAAALARLREQFPAADLTPRTDMAGMLEQVLSSLTEHPAAFDLPLDLRATAFQMRVWEALKCIPRGETRTYSEIACAIGQPTAVRAVGRACATNPVAVVIPCHRVVGSDGKLTGYRWGVERKKRLLELEKL